MYLVDIEIVKTAIYILKNQNHITNYIILVLNVAMLEHTTTASPQTCWVSWKMQAPMKQNFRTL